MAGSAACSARANCAPRKANAICASSDLEEFSQGLLLVLMPPYRLDADALAKVLQAMRGLRAEGVWLAASLFHRGDDKRASWRLQHIAAKARTPLIATNDVLYHTPERRVLQDVLSCIREKTTIETAGLMLEANAERHLKPAAEMARLFRLYPEAIAETLRFANRISFLARSAQIPVSRRAGAAGQDRARPSRRPDLARCWQDTIPAALTGSWKIPCDKELALIAKLEYAHYFLTVHDIVRYARSQAHPLPGPRLGGQFRGLLLLGVTSVNPAQIDVLFERFISEERQRAARHRRRFRARAPRGGDAVRLSSAMAATARRSAPP